MVTDIAELERSTFTLPWSEESFLDEVRNDGSHFTAAVLGGAPVGFCVLRHYEDEGEILNIAVTERHRSQGIGAALLGEALSFADAHGVERVFLEVRKSNEPAIGLYEKNGFRPLYIRKSYYEQPTEDAVIMVRETVKDK